MTTLSRQLVIRSTVAVGASVALAFSIITPTTHAGAAASTKMACGLGNGKKAKGTPIKVGAIVTSIPGIDFTDGTKTEAAYYKCVNDNGGINGRPIQLIVENDELDPAKAAAAATKLVEQDKVVAMVGGFSIIDCPVNQKYYASKNMSVIVAGVPAECFGSPNIAAVNMGPHYSAQGAAEAVVRAGAKGKIVHVTPKAPGSEYNGSSVKTIAEKAGMGFEDVQVDAPIKDGAAFGARERRFVEVARAIVGGPKLVLLDEPAAGLPDEETQALRNVIASIPERTGATAILVDHDMALVQGCCTTTAVLEFGRLLATGPTNEVLRDPRVMEAYLGTEELV